MICKKCGKYYPDDKNACPYCGTPTFYQSSTYTTTPNKPTSSVSRKTLGFILGFFFGILGLLGLLACSDSEEKNAFMQGWIIAFIISILIVVIAVFALIGFAACLPYRYYY